LPDLADRVQSDHGYLSDRIKNDNLPAVPPTKNNSTIGALDTFVKKAERAETCTIVLMGAHAPMTTGGHYQIKPNPRRNQSPVCTFFH
jgi:hypothetical protein